MSDQSSRGSFADEFMEEFTSLALCLSCTTANLLVIDADGPSLGVMVWTGGVAALACGEVRHTDITAILLGGKGFVLPIVDRS